MKRYVIGTVKEISCVVWFRFCSFLCGHLHHFRHGFGIWFAVYVLMCLHFGGWIPSGESDGPIHAPLAG